MKRRILCLCALLLAAALILTGCAKPAEENQPEMATMEPIQGTDLNKIVLEDVAYQSLGIKTDAVRAEGAGGQRRLVIPYSALIYDPKGDPYVYTSPAAKTYVRAPLVIDRFRGPDVVLAKGPSAGTQVVTVGDPELLGIEYGVGGE